jgi:hypothetical protein
MNGGYSERMYDHEVRGAYANKRPIFGVKTKGECVCVEVRDLAAVPEAGDSGRQWSGKATQWMEEEAIDNGT